MNICVTGSEGFIGTHLSRALLAQGHMVHGIDYHLPQVHGQDGVYGRIQDPNYTVLNAMVGDAECRSVYAKCKTIIHLAAHVGVGQSMYKPADYMTLNSLDTAKMLESLSISPPTRLIVASSMSIYGESRREFVDELEAPDIRNPYALTKYDQERLCLIWGEAHNVPVVALRFFNIYGEEQALNNPYTGVLAIFGCRLVNGKPPIVFEDGNQTRDFIHVSDIISAIIHCLDPVVSGGVYNVGTGIPTAIAELAVMLSKSLGSDIKPTITHQHRAGDIRHCFADVSKLKAAGWMASVKLNEGLKLYAEWLKSQPLPSDCTTVANDELKAHGLLS